MAPTILLNHRSQAQTPNSMFWNWIAFGLGVVIFSFAVNAFYIGYSTGWSAGQRGLAALIAGDLARDPLGEYHDDCDTDSGSEDEFERLLRDEVYDAEDEDSDEGRLCI